MKFRLAILVVAACAGLYLTGGPATAEDAPAATSDDVEVLTRGQVHEAYAEATATRGEPGVIVDRKPPRAINETPPDEKPEGDNIVWIPGYWSWDGEAKEFVWISGFWRAVPPGRTWVPGSWQKVEDGWQWVSGYWGKEGQDEEPEYLPTPPESIERGPSTPAPSSDCTYVPGCWLYRDCRFVWRPGYWLTFRPGWVWTPSCYTWTPCGYVFVPGYWDLPLCDRGLLFAPVRFCRTVYLRRTFVYRPAYIVEPDFLVGSLFVRSGSCCYYFGDYFAPRYRKIYIPWIEYRVDRVVYEPCYSYYRCAYADYPAWDRCLRTLYVERREGNIPAPPRTLVAQNRALNSLNANRSSNAVVLDSLNLTNAQNVTVVRPISRLNNVRVTGLAQLANLRPAVAPINKSIALEQVRKERLAEERRYAERLRLLAQQRRVVETRLTNNAPVSRISEPVRAKIVLPKSAPPARVINTPKPPPRPRVKLDNTVKPVPVRSKLDNSTTVTPPRPVYTAPAPVVRPRYDYTPKPAPAPRYDYTPKPAPAPRYDYTPKPAPAPRYDYTPRPAPAPAPRYDYYPRPAPQPAPRYDYTRPPQPNYPRYNYTNPRPQPRQDLENNSKDKKDKDKKKKDKDKKRRSALENTRAE